MKFAGLILKSARRSKRRTALTVLSVALAVFLFAALRAVLDGFNAGTEGASSTRIITQRSTSLMFQMPISYGDTIRTLPGVQDVTWANWFGGIYQDPRNFFAQFAIDPESYLRVYPEIVLTPDEKKAFLEDRTACIIGDGLARTYGFKVGDRITLRVGIPVYGQKDFDFTVKAIYRSGGSAVDNQSMYFNWKYADERSIQKGQAGWYVTKIADPDQAAADRESHRRTLRELVERDEDRHRARVPELVRLDVRQHQPAAEQHRRRRRDLDAVRRRQHDGDVGARADDGDRGHAHARLSVGHDLHAHRG